MEFFSLGGELIPSREELPLLPAAESFAVLSWEESFRGF
jgi:hypothetical protein